MANEDDLYDFIHKYGPEGSETHRPFTDAEKKTIGVSNEAKKLMEPIVRRNLFIENYGWSVPTLKAVKEIKNFVGGDQVLEIASGYGLWAKLMKDAGINIVATDLQIEVPESQTYYKPKRKQYTDIEVLSHLDALNKYGHFGVMMLVWPPYANPLAHEALKSFRGNKIILIGEGESGCTGDDNFYCLLSKEWQEVKRVEIPRWERIYDDLTFWTKK